MPRKILYTSKQTNISRILPPIPPSPRKKVLKKSKFYKTKTISTSTSNQSSK